MFFRKRNAGKEAAQDAKIMASQQLLMTATVETTQLAQDVTRAMQRRMEDTIQQFIATARIINDGLLICDTEGGITAFNPAAQRMFGLPDTPLMRANDLFLQDGATITADDLWKLGRAKKRTISGLNEHGVFPTHIRVAVLDRSDGTTVVLLVVQDLTLIEHSFNKSSHAYLIVSNNQVIAANSAAAAIYGYDPEELLGTSGSSIVSSKDRSGKHLDLSFELAKIQWEGEDAMLITVRQFGKKCPTCGVASKHNH